MSPETFKERVEVLREEVINLKVQNPNITNDIIEVTNQFFEEPIRGQNISAVEIWKSIQEMLDEVKLTAEEILGQRKIDKFYLRLIELMEIPTFEYLAAHVETSITPKVMKAYMIARNKLNETITILKEHMKMVDYSVLMKDKKSHVVYVADTPVGLAEIKIIPTESAATVKLFIEGDPKVKPSAIDITDEVKEFLKKTA